MILSSFKNIGYFSLFNGSPSNKTLRYKKFYCLGDVQLLGKYGNSVSKNTKFKETELFKRHEM